VLSYIKLLDAGDSVLFQIVAMLAKYTLTTGKDLISEKEE